MSWSRSLDRSLWSIQRFVDPSMWIASPLPFPASTFEIRRFRTITLWTSRRLKPQPVSPEPEPTPRMVLSEATRTSAEQVKLPLTRMTFGPAAATAVLSWSSEVTVIGAALPPPVVPPFWVAQPTRPVVGGGVLVFVGVGVGVRVGVGLGEPLAAVNVHCLVPTLSQELVCTSAPAAVELSLTFAHLPPLALTT